ncbi:MAG: phage major capsid protein, partial [Clostridia bacterium]|nr:phage major capsid protein [Clostridia bacterium]
MVTMTSADKALKSLYLGVVSEQLNTEVNPFFDEIKKTSEDGWGKEVRRVAKYGINGGIGAGTEDGYLPAASGNNYEQMVTTLKNLYGTIEISDKAIRASENDAGAFVNLLNAEMEGLIKSSQFNFGRMLFGDGTGTCAKVVSYSGNAIVVDSVKNLFEGMIIEFVSSGTVVSTVGARSIGAVDSSTKTVTVSGTAIAASVLAANELVVIQNSYNQEITGLGAIFKNSGTIYGLS